MPKKLKCYFDNASTSYPKAPGVAKSVYNFIENVGCNVNRGEYKVAYSAAEIMVETRERLCTLFGFDKPRGVIFTQNVTTALNVVLKGFLKAGDHLIVSAMEHNAVMRPVAQLAELGVEFSRAPCNDMGELMLEQLEALLRPNTRAIVMTHASNVCGTVLPIAQVGELCVRHGLRFIVDCAQTGGVLPVNMRAMHIDALCFTGHKGLLAPQGIGGFLIDEGFARELTPLISGGTGSFSDSEALPALLPDRFEAGTPNLPAIYGLHTALGYLTEHKTNRILEQEQAITQRFLQGLEGFLGVRIIGVKNAKKQTAIVSLDFIKKDNAEVAYRLESEHGIMTRCGLHCAPNAHKTLGTFPQGTVRFSFSHFTTADEIDFALEAIKWI